MNARNEADRIRRELLIKVIEAFNAGELETRLDRLPYELRPRGKAFSRCCVYKDRAVIKYRVMAILGVAIESETDEAKPLSAYAREAPRREGPDTNILSVLDIACDSCVKSRYLITEACRGCFARPCSLNCPKNAISVRDGKAAIDHSLCVKCGKCVMVCPFRAIIQVPVPCEDVCPVGAIDRSPSGKQYIDFEKCVSCGKCVSACPFGAVIEPSRILDILRAIKDGRRVAALVAPAIEGQFPGTLRQLAEALRKLGFARMAEVAYGAEIASEVEAEEFFERIGRGERLMTTSCCPAYTETVKRHVPELAPFVSKALSPMRYAAATVKREDPGAITVFIGPCVAKRKEAQTDPNVDYVMTFGELEAWLTAVGIDIAALEGVPLERNVEGYGRGFATSCGVTAALLKVRAKQDSERADGQSADIDARLIDGLDRAAVKKLALYAKGKLPGNFLEVMACEGGCVGGPCAIAGVDRAAKIVKRLAAE